MTAGDYWKSSPAHDEERALKVLEMVTEGQKGYMWPGIMDREAVRKKTERVQWFFFLCSLLKCRFLCTQHLKFPLLVYVSFSSPLSWLYTHTLQATSKGHVFGMAFSVWCTECVQQQKILLMMYVPKRHELKHNYLLNNL